MDQEEFLENVRQQFLDEDEIVLSMDSDFRKIESFDSLTGMTIIVMLKDEYGVAVSEAEFRALKTIRDLYDFAKVRKTK